MTDDEDYSAAEDEDDDYDDFELEEEETLPRGTRKRGRRRR